MSLRRTTSLRPSSSPSSLRSGAVLFAAVASATLLTAHVRAASGTWTGAGGDGLWATAGNWTAVPGSTSSTTSPDVATFTGAPASTAVTVDAGRNIAGLTFDNTSAPFTIGANDGNALTLSNGGTIRSTSTVSSTPDATGIVIAAPLVLAGSSYTFANDAPTGAVTDPVTGPSLRVTGSITAGGSGPTTLTLDGANSAGLSFGIFSQLSGAVADGPGSATLGITKNGTGSWEFNNTVQSTYSGPTIINQGILRFFTVESLSPNTDVTVNSGGTWRSSVAGVTARSLTINSGAGFSVSTSSSHTVILKNNSGPALQLNYAGGGPTLSAPFTLAGTTPLAGGVTLITDDSTGAVSIGATNSPFGLGSALRPFDIGKGSVANTSYDLRLRGPVSGGGASGGILKLGAGTLRLDNASQNWSGTLEVREGMVGVSASGAMTGTVALAVTGGDFHVYGSATQSFSSVTLTKGTLSASNDASTVRAPSFTINVAGGDTALADAVLADLSSPATVTKNGAGLATLSGMNTYTGVTTVNGGTLVLKGSGARDNVINNAGATVQLGATVSFDYDGANGGGTVQGQIVSLLRAGQASDFASGPIRSASPSSVRGFGWADDGNAVQVTAAYYGDTDLDGRVNADDYARIDRGYAASLSGWQNGDFNYDGTVNQDDYLLIDRAYAASGVPHAAFDALVTQRQAQFGDAYVSQLLASVPEPSSIAACLVAAPLLASRRRRRGV